VISKTSLVYPIGFLIHRKMVHGKQNTGIDGLLAKVLFKE